MKRKILFKIHLLGLAGLLLLPMASADAREVAAKVQFVVGSVTAESADGMQRQLKKGDRVYTGDTIKSGQRGAAQLIYRDRSRMAVRVNTQFRIVDYEFDEKSKSSGKSVFSLLTGALRTVSGLIGKITPQNVTVETPLATIGIRGTDHEVVHVVQQRGGSWAQVNPGTYNKVYSGATVMKTSKGKLNLKLHEVGFVGASGGKSLKPVQIKELPRAIREEVINKVPVQAKSKKKNQKKDETGNSTAGKKSAGSKRKNSAGSERQNSATHMNSVKGKAGSSKNYIGSPDVSITPAGPAPVPIPYPNTGTGNAGKLKPTKPKAGKNIPLGTNSLSIESYGKDATSQRIPTEITPVQKAPPSSVLVPKPSIAPKQIKLPQPVNPVKLPTPVVAPKSSLLPKSVVVPKVVVPKTVVPKSIKLPTPVVKPKIVVAPGRIKPKVKRGN